MIDRFLMASRWRWGRMCAAWGLMLTGCIMIGDVSGLIVTIFGFVPFVESLYDVNLVAPLIGRPLSVPRLRETAGASGNPLMLATVIGRVAR